MAEPAISLPALIAYPSIACILGLCMRHLDLFSGIGGFALATEMVWPEVSHEFVELDPFCQAVLRKHWPQATFHDDIKTYRGGSGPVDLVTGGFPCQPFSLAGKRKGTEDDRDLWPQMFRVICETQPRWVIGENVAGFVAMELERSVADLESAGYEVQSFIIPAAAVGAPHRRDRVWIVGHAGSERRRKNSRSAYGNESANERRSEIQSDQSGSSNKNDSDSQSKRLQRIEHEAYESRQESNDQLAHGRSGNGVASHNECKRLEGRDKQTYKFGGKAFRGNWLEVATRLCRVDDGVPKRVDRLKALGNAIVPQVAAEIMRAIRMADESI